MRLSYLSALCLAAVVIPALPSPADMMGPDGDASVLNGELVQGVLMIMKFEDGDQNGLRDVAEPLLPDWEFLIDGPGGFQTTVVTQWDGTVVMPLDLGTYTVTELSPPPGYAGWWVTTVNPLQVEILPGGTTIQFGNIP